MVKKIIKKIKDKLVPKQQTSQQQERRKSERRKADRRWMSKLIGSSEVPIERRSGTDRRMGDRRKK
ncbi:MAG: hypothetical protein NZ928_06625 [Endomicrobia bacterium]|nr:hypothetical protein [Endomicrobiia bacterium]MDW8055450.1 hypothetical protein [Elusimicrobiota bacterium]